jgi:hypothetical protein
MIVCNTLLEDIKGEGTKHEPYFRAKIPFIGLNR